MVEDAKPAIEKMKDALSELQKHVGKASDSELTVYVGACQAAFTKYDKEVVNIKRAIAMNKPKKAKAPKAGAVPAKASAPA